MPSLKLFFFGPGTGESIALCLPDGSWGLVDCYIPAKSDGTGVLEFLAEKEVSRLAFLCLTHPHADHFLGAERVIRKYKGRIDRLWRWDGLTHRDLQAKIIMAANARAQVTNDYLAEMGHQGRYPEVNEWANGFGELMLCLEEIRKATSYRHVAAPNLEPLTLIKTDLYQIKAIRPDPNLVADVENTILNEAVQPDGYIAFEEDEGSVLNSLSIVLQVEFERARVLLLGDAEGQDELLDPTVAQCCVKVAHHGSENGLGATGFCCPPSKRASVGCVVITPWKGRLPKRKMIERYQEVAGELILTESAGQVPESMLSRAPTLQKAKFVGRGAVWHGVEILGTGEVRRCS